MSPLAWLDRSLQFVLPTRALSSLMHWLTQIELPVVRKLSIRLLLRFYDIRLDEAAEPDPHAYPSLNAFFTRALKSGVRPLAPEPALISPVDGRVSQAGRIDGDGVFQAKGRQFSLAALLADAAAAAPYRDGDFATIYLAPHNYHRVHMPQAGRLLQTDFVPGRLFSVRPSTAASIDGLFARNERLVMHFDSPQGPFVVVMVGAMLVGSLETVFAGKLSPPHQRRPQHFDYRDRHLEFARGEELGRFNMGSTVILLFPPGAVQFNDALVPGQGLRLGEAIAKPQGT